KRSGPGGALKRQQTSHRRNSAADWRGRASPTHKNCESQRNALRSPHVQERRRAHVRAVTWITAAAEAPLYGFLADGVRRPDLAQRNAALGGETAASVIAVQVRARRRFSSGRSVVREDGSDDRQCSRVGDEWQARV